MAVTLSTLKELYDVGKEISLSNPKDPENPVLVYVRKLNPSQQEKAVRKANAARARKTQVLDRPADDEDRLIVMNQVDQLGDRLDLVEFLANMDLQRLEPKVRQELSDEPEWIDIIQPAFDAWNDGLKEEWDTTLLEPEKRSQDCIDVSKTVEEFNNAVEERVQANKERFTVEHDQKSDFDLRIEVANLFLDRDTGLEWLRAYHNWQIVYGVLDPETREPVFQSVEEIDEIDMAIYKELITAVKEIAIDPVDVKS